MYVIGPCSCRGGSQPRLGSSSGLGIWCCSEALAFCPVPRKLDSGTHTKMAVLNLIYLFPPDLPAKAASGERVFLCSPFQKLPHPPALSPSLLPHINYTSSLSLTHLLTWMGKCFADFPSRASCSSSHDTTRGLQQRNKYDTANTYPVTIQLRPPVFLRAHHGSELLDFVAAPALADVSPKA